MKAQMYLYHLYFITVITFSVDSKNAIDDPLVSGFMNLESTLLQLFSEHLLQNQSSRLLDEHNLTCFACAKSAFAPDLIAALRRICRNTSF